MAKQATVQKAPATAPAPKAAKVAKPTGIVSTAAQLAKAAKLQGQAAPAAVSKYQGSAVIKVLGDNPHRAGTYRYKAWVAMAACHTAGEYALTGYKTKYLPRWAAMGLIRVS